jgi:hypothetical protein
MKSSKLDFILTFLLSSILATSSMTLLDNLTAQLSSDRKGKFIELFRQLQVIYDKELYLGKFCSDLNFLHFRTMQ